MSDCNRATSQSPIIIIGAPRSGTNMLRDALCGLRGLESWPCDEINYIWRHGNRSYPTDELGAQFATPAVQRYIRRAFEKVQRRTGASCIVEKTCANSLRVPFVRQVVPDAHFVFLVRDGRAAAASAMRRWASKADVPYLLRKARFVPASDVPYYALRFASGRVARLRRADVRAGWWGPRIEGWQHLSETASLSEICARQWQRCVELASRDLSGVHPGQVTHVGYESFVQQPANELGRIAERCGIDVDRAELLRAVQHVSLDYLDRWDAHLDHHDREVIERVAEPTLQAHGYV